MPWRNQYIQIRLDFHCLLPLPLRIVSQNTVVANLVDRLLRNPYWQSVRFLFSRNVIRLWWTAFSRILDAIGNIDIGRWFSGLVESPDLKTGVIFAIFQTEGTVDVLIDKLIMYARGPAIISAQSLSRPGASSSIPGAFCLFRALSSFRTNLLDM